MNTLRIITDDYRWTQPFTATCPACGDDATWISRPRRLPEVRCPCDRADLHAQ